MNWVRVVSVYADHFEAMKCQECIINVVRQWRNPTKWWTVKINDDGHVLCKYDGYGYRWPISILDWKSDSLRPQYRCFWHGQFLLDAWPGQNHDQCNDFQAKPHRSHDSKREESMHKQNNQKPQLMKWSYQLPFSWCCQTSWFREEFELNTILIHFFEWS